MAVGVSKRLEVIAGEDAVEAVLLGLYAEPQ
jgi:hypothetical protein